MLENMFPAQCKTEFQSYFSQNYNRLVGEKKKKKKYKVFFLFSFFFINGYDIKIQKGNFPAVVINKML